MKKIIFILMAIVNINAYALPNMKNYEHKDGLLKTINTQIQLNYATFDKCKNSDGQFWYSYDFETKLHIFIVVDKEDYTNSICGISSKNELDEMSEETIICELENGNEVMFYYFKNGRYCFIPSVKIGFFQTWDN